MKSRVNKRCTGCQCRFWPALALLVALAPTDVRSQGTIVYGQFPSTEPATILPYDSWGTRVVGELGFPAVTYDLKINGETVLTFCSDGTEFKVMPSSLSAVIGVQPGLPNDPSPFVIALGENELIGPDAAGCSWLGNILGGDTLVACRDIGCIGYFTDVESAYIGLEFQEGGQTYYGWVRAGALLSFLNGGWVYDYAYETVPDTPIHAGEVRCPSRAQLPCCSSPARCSGWCAGACGKATDNTARRWPVPVFVSTGRAAPVGSREFRGPGHGRLRAVSSTSPVVFPYDSQGTRLWALRSVIPADLRLGHQWSNGIHLLLGD